jgi:purine-nucleoside phosphorylase
MRSGTIQSETPPSGDLPYDARVAAASAYLNRRGVLGRFDCALVLGTGLGRLGEEVEEPLAIQYTDVPHFPPVGVSGHGGQLIVGRVAGKRVMIFQGRAHFYETGDPAAMRVPIAVAAAFGIPSILFTNAAGAVKAELQPNSHVVITDHINYSGLNPLLGDRGDRRFVPMTNAYDDRLRRKMRLAGAAAGVLLSEGVYMWFSGPSFETPAEIRMARALGADLVGMSTVPEVILARYYGLRVVALSLVTNAAAGIGIPAHSHGDTKGVAAGAAPNLHRLISAFLARLDDV